MGITHRIVLMLALAGVLAACGQDTDNTTKQDTSDSRDAAPARADAGDGEPLVTGLPDFTALVKKEAPAVVNISTVTRRERSQQSQLDQLPEMFRRFFDEFGGPGGPGGGPAPRSETESLGSGFIISSDGYVLTNYHVVGEADEIVVRLQDRRELDAELIGSDPQSDLALIKVDASDLPVVDIGSSDDLQVGEWVLAIGAPFGFDSSVTAGIVSAKGRSLPTDNYVPFIQTDVAINPGNSGGPLFNLNGQVVGINSQIVSRSGGYMGLSFAIPIDLAMDVADQLKETGEVSRGWLGVLIQEVDRDLAESFGLDKPMGALVAQVQSGSPAAEAGLQPGDVIIAFNGREIQRSAQLPKWVGALKAGTEAEMTVVRDGDEKTLEVTVGELPDNPQAGMAGQPDQDQGESDKLGLEVRAASAAELARVKADHGVVITGVQDGPAARAGLSSGDLLVSLNGKPVDSLDAYREIAADLPDEGTVPALVNRDGNARFVAIKL
ncbi:MAG: DegQ family serine endoprotease [Alcanivorax sp.]|jgi:serine protease Do|uniref:DegQ family serine endoprotease n=1 Tax=Alloalcanivorax venustensis TaxID=172371 RepID=UPI000A708521|nr:DegQ family serine endoprotease [Alcanivorax sp.]SMO91891.1 serine protease Do [Alcanivorax sp. DSM 26295]HBS14003.1 serine peptidase [Alcanivorax sp.]|tara:strand:- start:68 stop:1552 length:1485 start_codon:yes stop_codon:yes gene_type:complete